jgi:hypothetical protein
MKNRLLVTVASAALIAGATFASAQTGGGPGGGSGSSPGAAQSGGPGGGGSSTMERGAAQPREGSSTQEQGTPPRQRTGQSRDAQPSQGQAPRATDQGQSPRQGQQGQTQQQGQDRQGAGQRGQAEQGRTGQGGRAETTGRAPADVTVTNEQRTQIRQRLGANTSARIDRNQVNFSLSVGVTVPRTVRVFDLPPEIVTIVPAYRGYKYVIVEDEILIIDPRTLRIVAVIEA